MKVKLSQLLESAFPAAVVHFLGGHPVPEVRLGAWSEHMELLRSLRRRTNLWFRMTEIDVETVPEAARWGAIADQPIPSPVLRQLYAACELTSRGVPRAECPECRGSGVYRGLLVVEPCRTCGSG